MSSSSHGLTLPNGTIAVHGEGANIKQPFADLPDLTMHELDAGVSFEKSSPDISSEIKTGRPFAGQLGFIPFTTSIRLPRHVHISSRVSGDSQRLVAERILVLSGTALVELNGEIYVIAPRTLVTIAPGVPHTWTACPDGVKLPDGTCSEGQFLMVYEYEAPTGFFPTAQIDTLANINDYKKFEGDLDKIRFPRLDAEAVVKQARLVWGRELRKIGH